jgi:hypothetical protein
LLLSFGEAKERREKNFHIKSIFLFFFLKKERRDKEYGNKNQSFDKAKNRRYLLLPKGALPRP